MEGLFSKETMELMKEKVEETLKLVVNLPKQYKIVLSATGAVIVVYWYMKRNHGFFRKLGIPGPKPGLLGAMGEYSKKGLAGFDQEMMKKYGKVVGIFHASQPIYLISDAEMIKQIKVKEFQTFVNRNSDLFPEDPVFKQSILSARDDNWKFIRGILSPTFTSGKMREMSPLIQKCVDSMLESFWTLSEGGKKSMKMKEVFSMFTMDVIASVAFGVEVDCQKDPDNVFLKNARKIMNPGFKVLAPFYLCTIFPFLKKFFEAIGTRQVDALAGDFFLKIVREVIEQRKEENLSRTDFLQLLLNSHKLEMDHSDEDPDTYLEFDKTKRRGLSNAEIVGNAFIFLLAGFDTTAHALTMAAYCLATNPDCQEKLIKEVDKVLNGKPPDYDSVSQLQHLENVFLETLRLYPAAVRSSRIASKDIKINGYLIKKGVDIHFPVIAIHNDPDYWRNPEKFDPDRFLPENRPENYNYVYLTFGAGPRNCVGMRLAHMEAKMAIAGILQKYKFKLAPETKIPPDLDKMQMRPKDGMVLMIEKR